MKYARSTRKEMARQVKLYSLSFFITVKQRVPVLRNMSVSIRRYLLLLQNSSCPCHRTKHMHSPAVAERPRDASCLSSIVQYLEHNLLLFVTSVLDLRLRTIKFCSALFGAVVDAGCNKQDSLMRGGLRGKRTST